MEAEFLLVEFVVEFDLITKEAGTRSASEQ